MIFEIHAITDFCKWSKLFLQVFDRISVVFGEVYRWTIPTNFQALLRSSQARHGSDREAGQSAAAVATEWLAAFEVIPMTHPKLQKLDGRWTFAEGGTGRANRMLPEVPAEPAPRGRTGPSQARAPGARAAKGGPKNVGYGLALPAVGGATTPVRFGKGR
jgi:hypothetical protein